MTHYKTNIGQPTSCLFTDDQRGLSTSEDPMFVDCPLCLQLIVKEAHEKMGEGIIREPVKMEPDFVTHCYKDGPACGVSAEEDQFSNVLEHIDCPRCFRIAAQLPGLLIPESIPEPAEKSLDQLEDELARKLLGYCLEPQLTCEARDEVIRSYRTLMEARAHRLGAQTTTWITVPPESTPEKVGKRVSEAVMKKMPEITPMTGSASAGPQDIREFGLEKLKEIVPEPCWGSLDKQTGKASAEFEEATKK